MKKTSLSAVMSSIFSLVIVLVLVGGGIFAVRALTKDEEASRDDGGITLHKVYSEKNLTTLDYDIPLTEDAKHFRIEISGHFYNDSQIHDLVVDSEVYDRFMLFEKVDGTSVTISDTSNLIPLTDTSAGEKYCKIVLSYNIEQVNNSLDVEVFIDNIAQGSSDSVYIRGTLIAGFGKLNALNLSGKISDYSDGQVVVYQWL